MFTIHTYSKKELALMYFPQSSPRAAVAHLMSWISRSTELAQQLRQSGYRPTQKDFTPRQVAAIVELLGEP